MAVVGDIIRLAIHYTQPNASDIMSVFHFLVQGEDILNATLRGSLDSWVDNAWGAAWDNIAPTSCQLDRWEADIVNAAGEVVETVGGSSVNRNGVMSGDPLPPGVAGYIMAYTDVPKARGSKYIPCMGEGECSGGVFSATALTNLAALLVLYLADAEMGAGTFLIPGVLSKVLEEFLPFRNTGIVDDRPAYQRRRKRGVGG